jgi:hypothetical protein
MPRLFSIALLLVLAIVASGEPPAKVPDAGAKPSPKSNTMKMDPPEFEKVSLDERSKNVCSPKDPGLAWRGVAISAPKRISFPASQGCRVVPICGFYRINALAKTDAGFLLVAKNLKEEKPRSGRIVSVKDPSPEEPMPPEKPLDPKLFEGVATASYFNTNLASYVILLPETGTYDIHVEFAGLKSNTVRIEIVAE